MLQETTQPRGCRGLHRCWHSGLMLLVADQETQGSLPTWHFIPAWLSSPQNPGQILSTKNVLARAAIRLIWKPVSARLWVSHFGSKQVECILLWPYHLQATTFLRKTVTAFFIHQRFHLLVLLEISTSLRSGYCTADKALKFRQAVLQTVGFYCSQILLAEWQVLFSWGNLGMPALAS